MNIIKSFLFLFIISYATACTQHTASEEATESVTFTVNGESFEMVYVEGGTFVMGCTGEQGKDCENNEKPAHEERVDTFYIGKYEVTQKLWNAVIGPQLNRSSNTGCDDCPVEQVSWKDAQVFITKLRILTKKPFRLPTETEWEYAARGGNRSKGYKYSGSDKIDEVAWYMENYQKKQMRKNRNYPSGRDEKTQRTGYIRHERECMGMVR